MKDSSTLNTLVRNLLNVSFALTIVTRHIHSNPKLLAFPIHLVNRCPNLTRQMLYWQRHSRNDATGATCGLNHERPILLALREAKTRGHNRYHPRNFPISIKKRGPSSLIQCQEIPLQCGVDIRNLSYQPQHLPKWTTTRVEISASSCNIEASLQFESSNPKKNTKAPPFIA
jgi:hypothetical protein